MISSIRKYLLINLLLAVVITTSLTVVGNYYLDRKDIEPHLDALLSQVAFNFEAVLGEDFRERDLKKLQNSLNSIPHKTQTLFLQDLAHYSAYLSDRYQFQVWDNKGKLMLYSHSAPTVRLSDTRHGYSDKVVDNILWRSFTIYNPRWGTTVIAAEKYKTRSYLASKIAEDDIFIMLLNFPFAGLLIWFIVGRGLQSISRVANEVRHRLPNYLEPVDSENVPSEIKPLVSELNKLFLRLQQAIEREKRFAGDAAHELRTPLAALKTQAQVALKTASDKERHAILQNVITGVDRCNHVVQQLLTLSRLVPESHTLSDVITLNLSRLTAEIIAQLAPLALEKNIEIELIADPEETLIMGNVTALSILIRNLVDNAIRYTEEYGFVKILVHNEKDQVVLHVVDNGPGIPEELRARVFERFFRVLGTASSGSGLGLAIVQQIAQLHKATVKLGTPSGDGTGLEVFVFFPRNRSVVT